MVAKSRTLLHRIKSVKPSYFPWQFLSAFAKLINSDYRLRHVRPFVLPQGTTLFPMDGFS